MFKMISWDQPLSIEICGLWWVTVINPKIIRTTFQIFERLADLGRHFWAAAMASKRDLAEWWRQGWDPSTRAQRKNDSPLDRGSKSLPCLQDAVSQREARLSQCLQDGWCLNRFVERFVSRLPSHRKQGKMATVFFDSMAV